VSSFFVAPVAVGAAGGGSVGTTGCEAPAAAKDAAAGGRFATAATPPRAASTPMAAAASHAVRRFGSSGTRTEAYDVFGVDACQDGPVTPEVDGGIVAESESEGG
jgi:hypothetical protein